MIILRGTSGEGGGGSDATHTEKIVLQIVCPPQDFSNTGGIKDAMDALNRLNAKFDQTRNNLQRGFQIGGSSGNVSASGQIKLTISGSAIAATLTPGEKIKLALRSSDFEMAASGTPTGSHGGSQRGASSLGARGSRRMPAEEINRTYTLREAGALNQFGIAMSGISGTSAQARRAKLEADVAYHSQIQSAAGSAASAAGDAGLNDLQLSYLKKQARAYRNGESAAMSLRLETDKLNDSTSLIGRNLIQNAKHAASWATSATVLYGSLQLVRRSLQENMEIGREMAVLSVTFKGGADAVSQLTTGVIGLATANGQSAKEAVESATEWSRLFHTEKEVLDGTNASLILANTSGEEAAKTTEFLSMMVQIYKLRASELNVVIGQMASISQNANVTQKDLMRGMEASGEAAKEAGMSYSQTFGLIAGGVSATKQSGTAIGNTIKTFTTQMSNPAIQNKLRFGAGIEVTNGGAGLREMPEIINQIYVAYQRMSRAERESFLFSVGGRQNATRLAGILDQYIQGQVAEWDRFINIQGSGAFGPMRALTDVSKALKEILQIANAPAVQPLVTLMGAMGIGIGARLLVSGLSSSAATSAESGIKDGILVSTFRALKNDASALGNVFDDTALVGARRFSWLMSKIGVNASAATTEVLGMNVAVRGLAVSLAALTDVIIPLLAVWAGIKTFNYLADASHSTASAASEADQARAAMSAHTDRARLIQTASDALGDVRTPNSRRITIARQIASAELPFGTPARIASLEQENQSLIEQGRLSELLNHLAAARVMAEHQATAARLQGKNAIQQQIMLEEQHFEGMRRYYTSAVLSGERLSQLFGGEGIERIGEYLHGVDNTIDETRKHIGELRKQLGDFDEAAAQASADSYARSQIRAGVIGAGQALAFQGIGAQYGMLGAASPLDEYNRKLAQLTTQQGYLNREREALEVPGAFGLNPEQLDRAREEAMQQYVQNGSALAAMQMPGAIRQAQDQTRLGVYGKMGRAEWEGFARAPMRGDEEEGLTPGWTEGEQLVNQSILGKGRLQELRYEMQTRQGSDGEMRQRGAEALQIEIGLMENKMTAQLKIIELTKEEINLNAQARREYERTLLTSSPSELLRKAATMRLSHGHPLGGPGGMGAGEFFARSQESREDLLRMPGNTEGERNARRARGALETYFGRRSAFDVGEQAVGGAIPIARYGGIVAAPSPDFNIPSSVLSAVMELGSAAERTARHTIALGDAMVDVLNRLAAHNASHNSGPPPIAQTVPNWTQR